MRKTHRIARTSVRMARGFSLLELSLVLLIIGLLMGVAAWSFVGRANAAKIQTTKATMGMIKAAIQQYQVHENMYPVDLDALTKGKNPYLDDSKKNMDSWDHALRYAVPGREGRPFSLVSAGEDGQVGTDDDIDIWDMDKKPTQ